MSKRVPAFLTAAIIIGLVGLIYWPVHTADFVWDDKICLHDAAWLRNGGSWNQILSAHFCDWSNYFRPLVVAMWAAEVRIFNVAPGPMHMISLGLHLMNTLLVGLLAKNLSAQRDNRSSVLAGTAMLLYGLHPALIEPVVWISCRADLVLTLFLLLALLANITVQSASMRALAVGMCFFLAACAKESAATFPVLLLLFDWISLDFPQSKRGLPTQLRTIWQRQWPVYATLLGAGIVYLALRIATLGFLIDANGSPSVTLPARVQTVAYTLWTYWRILVWPMVDLGPTHSVDPVRFEAITAGSISIDAAVLAILLAGIYGTFRRNLLACAIVAVTVSLLPVLHILPVQFDPSLYHERYIMLGLALALSLLPRMISDIALPAVKPQIAVVAGTALGLLWLGIAAMNIRVTLPLWSDETRLWQWAARHDPNSTIAKVNLLALYIDRHDRVHAHQLADELLAEEHPCEICMLNVASEAMVEGDLARARSALGRIQNSMNPTETRDWNGFILATGRLRELEHDFAGAADAYHEALAMDPLDPMAHSAYALFLARQGKSAEARAALDETLPLFSPDVREQRRQEFDRTLSAALQSAQPPAASQQP